MPQHDMQERIRQNVAKMQAKGATPAEIESYLRDYEGLSPAGQPAAAPAPDPVSGMFNSLANLRQGMFAPGFADNARGAVSGGLEALKRVLTPFRSPEAARGDVDAVRGAYTAARDADRAQVQQYADEHGRTAAVGGQVVGGLMTGKFLPRVQGQMVSTKGLGNVLAGGRMRAAATEGALMGGVAGAGLSDGDFGEAAKGAALGLAMGPIAEKVLPGLVNTAGRAGGWALDLAPQRLRNALSRFNGPPPAGTQPRHSINPGMGDEVQIDSWDDRALGAVYQAGERAGLTPQQIGDAIAEWGDKPVTVQEIIGTAARKLGRAVHTIPSRGGQELSRKLRLRMTGDLDAGIPSQEDRLVEGVKEMSGLDRTVFTKEADEIAQGQWENAAPLFDKAFGAHGAVDHPRVLQIVEEIADIAPEARRAVDARIERLIKHGRAKPEDFFEVRRGPDGQEQRIPTLRYLDQLKQRADDEINWNRQPMQPRKYDTKDEGDLKSLRAELLDILDNELGFTDYSEARAAWAGPYQTKEAMDLGRSLYRGDNRGILHPDEIAHQTQGAAPDAQTALRKGGVEELIRAIEGVDADVDATRIKALRDNTTAQKKLGLLAKDDDARRAFTREVQQEAEMGLTNRFVSGGSNTVDKALEVADLVGADVPGMAADFATSPHGAITRALARVVQSKMGQRLQGRTEALVDALEPKLTAGIESREDLLRLVEALKRVQARQVATAERRSRQRRAGVGVISGQDY